MKSGKNSLKQLIESTINAWCCCDTTDSRMLEESDNKYARLLKFSNDTDDALDLSEQVILGHEIALEIERKAWVDKYFSMNEKMRDADQEIYRLRNVDDLNGKRTVQLIAITAASIMAMIAAAWGWLVVFGIVPI